MATDVAQLGITVDTSGLRRGDEALGRFESRARRTESATDRFSQRSATAFGRVSAATAQVRARVLSLQTALGGLGVAFVARHVLREFAQFEQGLVNVGKTTGLEGARLQQLGERIEGIGQEVPVATGRLLDLATAAGQLGVKGVDNIAAFTETLGKMELATDVAGEEGARSLARLLTITGEAIPDVDRLGSSIVALGNNMATTESEIVRTSTFLAASTSAFGLNAREVAGLSAALRALGQRAETSGSSVGAAFTEISTALAEGGDNLRALIDMTGMSADQLRTTFRDDATAVLVEFSEALGNLPAAEQTEALEQFNLAGRETRRVLLAMAERVDVLRRGLGLSEQGWSDNTALTEEAMVAAQSFSAQMTLATNSVDEAARAIGAELAPVIVDLTQDFREFIAEAQRTGQITAAAESLGDAFQGVAQNLDLIASAGGGLVGGRVGSGVGAIVGTLFGPAGTATGAAIGTAIGSVSGALATYIATTEDADRVTQELEGAINRLNTAGEEQISTAMEVGRAQLQQARAAIEAAEANRDLAASGELAAMAGLSGPDLAEGAPASRALERRRRQLAELERAFARRTGAVSDTGFVPEASRGGTDTGGGEGDPSGEPGTGGGGSDGPSDAIERVTDRLKFQKEQLERTTREQAIYNDLQQAGIDRSHKYGDQVATLSGQLFDARMRQEEMNARLQFFGDIASGAFSDLASGAADFETVMERVVQSLADAALQAALLGQGPLAGLFGTRSATGDVGGLFGAFAGGFQHGGTIPRGHWGIVGERGPEPVIAGDQPVRVLPNSTAGGEGAINAAITVNMDARGADRDAIERSVAELRRDLPQIVVRTVRDARSRKAL